MNEYIETDVLIIGIGLAGASSALKLADLGLNVTIVTKSLNEEESNTYYAQGGIIYKSENDTPEKLAQDIINAGDGLCKPRAVELLCKQGPQYVKEILLDRLHIPFDTNARHEHELAAEGGHSLARILHTSDTTGKSIQLAMLKALKEHPKVDIKTGLSVIDLLTPEHHSTNILKVYDPISCVGAFLLDRRTDKIIRCIARFTVLATGGCGQLYLRTTNPSGALGDGIAMAYRAGARVINMEYIQFHPTTFFHSQAPAFLISEAVRGAGARLMNPRGEYFMENYSRDWKDLAPRDVVARAIHSEMLKYDVSHVYLDFHSFITAENIRNKFPNIYEFCKKYGFDIIKESVPVVPAAHYSCGGIWVDLEGRTTIRNLFAVGEVACTGLHGANRLASTSLLESLTFGIEAAKQISNEASRISLTDQIEIPSWESGENFEPDAALIAQDMSAIRHIMWNYVGLIRNKYRLQRALQDLRDLEQEIDRFYRKAKITDELLGLRNAARTAVIIASAAWENRQSLGCHYREN
jgi:L-aspartate oxidase